MAPSPMDEALSPDPKAPRNLAEELIKKMGKDEMSPGPLEKQSYAQQVNHFRILTHVIENTYGLCRDKDDMKQTLFHIAAINGAQRAIMICLSVIDGCCGRRYAHDPGCATVKSLLTSVDKEGYSPLTYSITKSKIPAVSGMLDLLGNTSPEEIRKLLRKAIASNSGNNVEIMRELLTVRPAGKEKEYRTDVLQQDILQLAAKCFNFEVFEFLLGIGSTFLGSLDCSLIHYVVYIGQVEAAKYLLKEFPDLATSLHVHPDHTSGPGSNTTMGEHKTPILALGPALSAEADEEKFPVLALYNGEDTELRDLIFETLMERLPISELREHLRGDTWTGKEISLDVTILAFDPHSLTEFLRSVRSDIERLEECVRRQLARDVDNADEEPVQTVRLADILVDNLPHIDCDGIEFERILKYVNIPSFPRQLGERRTDTISIFQWLKAYKRVKRVFEVTVDDCRHCPTTEEDIEMAFQDLDVQHLDWRRTDLSITSIANVAKELKTLHLYSSGSLAAIDHWLGPKGISILNLDRLYIHVMQDGFVSEGRAILCKKLCDEAELKVKTKPVVTIETDWIPEPAGHSHHGSAGSARKQSPIEVTGLVYFIQHYSGARIQQLNLALNCHKLHSPLPKSISNTRTKVAILDSGVNGTRFPLQSHERHGRSFVWRDNGKGHQSEASWWLAVDPHGSHMANIISQLDPFCVFYFFQIADDMNYIELPTVVKALEWAIKLEVDIINCSFALGTSSPQLEEVLRKAKKKDIIIMCSTADEGENTDEVWPAAYYRREQDKAEKFENIFPIVGCDEHGKFSKYANEGAGRYMFRGEDVDTSSTDPSVPIETANVQGSSVATAMATGVASLILACYRMVQDTQSSPSGLVDACFFRMSEQLRKGNAQDRTRLLAKASNFFPVGEDDIRDAGDFLDCMALRFNDVS
ncbi:Peptidase S8/S53, subtilisin/kexin/sedolisin [Ilyonectria robusta]